MDDVPEDVKHQYKLDEKVMQNRWVYVEIRKEMYGLLQAGLLAQEFLKERLSKNGYTQSMLTPSMWKHHTLPVQFCLIINDFGVKYMGKEHMKHLKRIIEQCNKVWMDWSETKYVELTLD